MVRWWQAAVLLEWYDLGTRRGCAVYEAFADWQPRTAGTWSGKNAKMVAPLNQTAPSRA
jgi:hypothetical protein